MCIIGIKSLNLKYVCFCFYTPLHKYVNLGLKKINPSLCPKVFKCLIQSVQDINLLNFFVHILTFLLNNYVTKSIMKYPSLKCFNYFVYMYTALNNTKLSKLLVFNIFWVLTYITRDLHKFILCCSVLVH